MTVFLAFTAGLVLASISFFFIYKVMAKTSEKNFELMAQNIFGNYQDFISEKHERDLKDRASVQERISQMIHAASRIEKETHQLAQALSSDVKFQGNWGELTLEKILESVGLVKGREYLTQTHFENNQKIYRPDVIINLPDNTHMIIDSKVSLTAYFKYLESQDEKDLKSLKDSVKKHIDQLASKNYQLIPELNSPEFVYLFIPVEGVYSLVLKEFPELMDESIKKNIVLVSPMNLMANLKTVAALWRIDKQSKSATEIATKAGAMYDKFALLVEDMEKLGSQINRTQSLYEDINKRIHTGRGNLMDKALELKERGAKTSKEINHSH